jgi:hypothetical protein
MRLFLFKPKLFATYKVILTFSSQAVKQKNRKNTRGSLDCWLDLLPLVIVPLD